MGQHPNGQHGAHQFRDAQPWSQAPGYASPPGSAGNGIVNLTRGYVPVLAVVSIVGMTAYGSWVAGTWWQQQKSTMETVQQDVVMLKQDVTVVKQSQAKIEASQTRQEDLLKRIADQPPWYTSTVKQAAR